MISPALSAALADWLDHLRALDGASPNTISAYQTDVLGWLGFLGLHLWGRRHPGRYRRADRFGHARLDGA